MYVSETVWFKKQQKRKQLLKKVVCGTGAFLLLLFLCSCGVCLWEKEESAVAEAADNTIMGSQETTMDKFIKWPKEKVEIQATKKQDMTKQDAEIVAEINQEPLIVIDAGHGGEDEGCSWEEQEEKNLNLRLANMLKETLEENGFRVLLTREEDEALSLEERVILANEAQGDLFLSIHQNASEDQMVHGVETWYCEESSEQSERLAKLVQQYVVLYTKARDRGVVETDTLYVIRECNMPSCLVETGFLSNKDEREKLVTEEYMEKIVEGITDAVQLYFEPKKMYLTFDDGPSAENTTAVLDILKEQGVKATFFVVGKNVEKHPEIAKRIVEEGHTIGIHCYDHSYDVVYESVEGYLEDFEKARSIVYETTGVEAWCFRFPGGSINTYNEDIYEDIIQEMTNKGYVYYDWNASLEDAVKKNTPEQLIKNAKESTLQRKRVVMLAHDIVYSTTLCLEDLLGEFPEYEFLPLTKDVSPVQF